MMSQRYLLSLLERNGAYSVTADNSPSAASASEYDLKQYLRQPDASQHAVLIGITLLMACLGRLLWALVVNIRPLRFMTTHLVGLLAAIAFLPAALMYASAAGLLPHSILIGVCGTLATAPKPSVGHMRLFMFSALSALMFSCVATPLLLPDLVPWTPYSLMPTLDSSTASGPPMTSFLVRHFVAPHEWYRIWLPEGTSLTSTSPIDVWQHRAFVSAEGWVKLSPESHIMSAGTATTIRRVNAYLEQHSFVALLGPHAVIANCTFHCDTFPCVVFHRAHVRTLRMSDVVVTDSRDEGSAYHLDKLSVSTSDDDDDRAQRLCSVPAVVCIGASTSAEASEQQHQDHSPLLLSATSTDGAKGWCGASESDEADTGLHVIRSACHDLARMIPWTRRAVDKAPAALGRVHSVLTFVHRRCAAPLADALVRSATVVISAVAPYVNLLGRCLWKFFVAGGCRLAPVVSVAAEVAVHDYCDRVRSLYAHDFVFTFATRSWDWIVTEVGRVEARIPLVSPSLQYAWQWELQVASHLWIATWWALRLAVTGLVLVCQGPLWFGFVSPMTTAMSCMMSAVCRAVCWSMETAISWDQADWTAAVEMNAQAMFAVCIGLQPLIVVAKVLWGVAWGVWDAYHTSTTLSTQLFVVLLQSGLLALVLYRDFQNRVQRHREELRGASSMSRWFSLGSPWTAPAVPPTESPVATTAEPTAGPSSFFASISSIPVVSVSMFRHYSKPVGVYVVSHLVVLILAVGCMAIPFFGGRLYLLVSMWVLPGTSMFAWSNFFVDRNAPGFWPYFSSRCAARVVLCVILQKTVGDFIFHVVYEIMIGLLLTAACFAAVVVHGRRKQMGAKEACPSQVNADGVASHEGKRLPANDAVNHVGPAVAPLPASPP